MDHIDSMAEWHPDDKHVNTWYKVAHEQWQLMELQHKLQQTQSSTFSFFYGGFTLQALPSTPVLVSPQAGAAPLFIPHIAPLCFLSQAVPIDCGKAGHLAHYCPQELEVCYLSASEQEELLIQLLAVQDTTGTPFPDTPTAIQSDDVSNVLEKVPTESEDF
ncbi:hypothetical protein C0989_004953 [Termitomyces sp. Mn162]|nr:hypothetical protein C0989_004953 [Termitomyces sp. Mn162]